jgi:hypothetical protein
VLVVAWVVLAVDWAVLAVDWAGLVAGGDGPWASGRRSVAGGLRSRAPYVGAVHHLGCGSGQEPTAAIWDFDPVTNTSALLTAIPQAYCGTIQDLRFTPDGSQLRASIFQKNVILGIGPSGSTSVVLGGSDGLHGPGSMDYDPSGNFFVQNWGGLPHIQRFPAAGGPGEVFADTDDGLLGDGPVAATPDGHLYYGNPGSSKSTILRFTPDGDRSVFATLEDTQLWDLVVDSSNTLFAATNKGVFRFPDGDPSLGEVFSSSPGGLSGFALSPNGRTLYSLGVTGGIVGIDVETGASSLVGYVEQIVGSDVYFANGLTVYVPEPCSIIALAMTLPALRVRRRGGLIER